MVENRSILDNENIIWVFIDLDDTLWNFTENSPIALKQVMQSVHVGLDNETYSRFASIYHDKNNELWELYHYGKIEKEYLVTERFRYSLVAIDYKCKDVVKLSQLINNQYLETLSMLPNIVSGADVLLQYLKSKYKIGILSNGFKGIQAQKLRSGGLDKYIDLIVLSDEVGITKPLKGIFDYALTKSKVNKENVVMIGDNYDADICGANNAGWKTIFFNRKRVDITDSIADVTVTELKEIIGVL